MKKAFFILLILLANKGFCQDLAFADDGKKVNGYAHLDTVINLSKKILLPGKLFIFKRVNNPNEDIVIGSDTVRSGIMLPYKDSIDRFCLINTGSKPIKYKRQDGSLIAIKEAQAFDNQWRPIEFWNYSWCGLSYSEHSVLPGQMLLLYTFKQYGALTRKVRLRLKTESNGVILSEPFEGTLDESYFMLNTELERFKPILATHLNYLK